MTTPESVYGRRSKDGSGSPLVTIGIPTYNGAARIQKALMSALLQSYNNLEILIGDNASTDTTYEVCQKAIATHPQVRYVRHDQNIGLIANFSFLLHNAHGKYFMWLSDDDTITPGIIEKYVDLLESNDDWALVSGVIEYSTAGTQAKTYEQGFDLLGSSPFCRMVTYYRRVVFGAVFHGLMRTDLARKLELRNLIGSDWHFVANLAYLGKIRNVGFVGYHKTWGGASRDFRNYATAIDESEFARRYPHVKIASDAYVEVVRNSDIFRRKSLLYRVLLGSCCFMAVISHHYLTVYPFIVGGRLKRALERGLKSVRSPGAKEIAES